jgi:endonuclease YncB( thermonuclease family)
MPSISRQLVALAFCLLFLPPAHAETFTGKVVTILDGDTVEVLVDQRPQRVRLEGIDAPEKAQPFGARAKQRLADLVGGQVVTVESEKVDKYGRTVGKLTLNGVDVNLGFGHGAAVLGLYDKTTLVNDY